LIQQRNCARVFDRVNELNDPARTLYSGAANACLAAIKGRGELWADAEAALATVAGRRGEFNCLDVAALAVLERLVTAHRKHPDRQFVLATGGGSAQSPPCPSITRLDPERGVGGTDVTIVGRHLDANIRDVEIIDSNGGSTGVGFTPGEGGLRITMPPQPDGSSTVCVVLQARPGWIADGELFTYEAAATATTSAAEAIACPPKAD